MKTRNLVALIVGTLGFNIIFWGEEIALNFSLFSAFSVLVNYLNHPEIFAKRNVQLTTAGTFVATFFMMYHNSFVSQVAAISSWVIMMGFYQQDELRSVHRALLSSILNFFKFPPVLKFKIADDAEYSVSKFERGLRVVVFPILGLLLFVVIFYNANSVFEKLVDALINNVEWFFITFFAEFSGERFLFFIAGLFLTSWFVYRGMNGYFTNVEKSKTEDLLRKRKIRTKPEFNTMKQGLQTGLKTENRAGVTLMGMVSVLLVFVNILDIIYVWFGADFESKRDFSADVHQGVNLLIFSIFLSIFIMIFYFRRNQNFYSKNKRMKQMAFFWIIQNFILIISVIIRNSHYIQYHGLTQKRIGVFVFLIVVAVGLISLYKKINGTKSFFYLAKFNSWSLYAVLIFLACFNWDMIIFRHNFNNRTEKTIDISYLVDLSDEVILNLNSKVALLEQEDDQLWSSYSYSRSGRSSLRNRMQSIRRKYLNDETTVFSWSHRTTRMNRFFVNYESRLDAKQLANAKEDRRQLELKFN